MDDNVLIGATRKGNGQILRSTRLRPTHVGPTTTVERNDLRAGEEVVSLPCATVDAKPGWLIGTRNKSNAIIRLFFDLSHGIGDGGFMCRREW